MTREQILDDIRTILVETRGCDESEVVPEATLMFDIDLESIDFLEISFRMEEMFGFPYPTETLGTALGTACGDGEPRENVLKALGTLRDVFYLDIKPENMLGMNVLDRRQNLLNMLTVESLVIFVERMREAPLEDL